MSETAERISLAKEGERKEVLVDQSGQSYIVGVVFSVPVSKQVLAEIDRAITRCLVPEIDSILDQYQGKIAKRGPK